MRNILCGICALLAIGHSSVVWATGCDDVYRDAVRNRNFSESDYSSLNTVYDQLCTSTGEKNSSGWNVGLNVIVEDLPIGLTAGGKDNSEKVTNFCHNYHSLRYDASHKVAQSDEVVVAALKNYNSCKEIEFRTGVVVTHKFANPDALLVNFDFKNANTFLKIDGVLATNLTCRSNEAPKGQEALSKTSNFEMRANFVISCYRVRSSTPDKGAAYAYLPASLAIGTNIDLYTLSMEADSLYNNNVASDATAKIRGLQQTLSAEQGKNVELSNFKARVDKMNVDIIPVVTGDAHPGGGGTWYPTNTNMDDVTKKLLCPGAVWSGWKRIATEGGGGHGYGRNAVVCIRY